MGERDEITKVEYGIIINQTNFQTFFLILIVQLFLSLHPDSTICSQHFEVYNKDLPTSYYQVNITQEDNIPQIRLKIREVVE